ncbi:YARHG domain-containing protein [candidate division KSB1 bacterium]|nr:YARHG domain-containing protein [candidate division KSB1 bacterium]MBL7095600.1 YARHG domain-containing protein [candidate division KSB1 bacterium]
MQKLLPLLLIIFVLMLTIQDVHGIIAPIRISTENNVMLVSSDEINLRFEQVELYHHPIGIWLVEYEAVLKNERILPIKQPVGFPSGFDVRMIENDLYCDRFDNFLVFENNKKIQNINYLVKCMNYVESTSTKWEMGDGSGVGFLNTWELSFEPEESKTIKITFTINVNKPPMNFDMDNGESWYTDSMEWVKTEYERREQNDFKLPLSLGSFWAFYPDSIVIKSYFSEGWLNVTSRSKREYKKKHIKRCEFCEPFGFYSPPNVILKSPTIETLQKMTRDERKILKNSFPAKYGNVFKSKILNSFFSRQPWYSESPEFNVWLLTDWDFDNMKLIHEFEKILH